MSILNGEVENSKVFAEEMPYGKKLHMQHSVETPAFCVAGMKDLLVSGGVDYLALYELDEEGAIVEISRLSIPGTVRQISVNGTFAYVSARDGGILVCDLTVPKTPVLACVLDSLELATGICASGSLLAVTNRHMGCELYDISNPYKPIHRADFMCGEAQSVWLYRQYAVVSDWINKKAAIFDISDMNDIHQIGYVEVDGFADGVCVFERDGRSILLVGTGHHSRRLKNRRKYNLYEYVTAEMIAEGYGCGHGIEIFDITRPELPVRLSGLKTPPSYSGPDTWLVYTDGKECIFTDSISGVFVISLENLLSPYFKGYYRLKPLQQQSMKMPSLQIRTGAVTGAASVKGYLCIASMEEGVQVLEKCLSDFVQPDTTVLLTNTVLEQVKGQLHSFVQIEECGKRVFCACGDAGIEILKADGSLLGRFDTEGICCDLCEKEGFLITAQGRKGIIVYEVTDDTLQKVCVCDVGGNVRQVVAVPGGICCVIGCSQVAFLEFSSGKLTMRHQKISTGLLYHRHLARTMAGEYIVAQSLTHGPTLISIKNWDWAEVIKYGQVTCAFEEGACGYGDKLIFIKDSQYACLADPKQLNETIPWQRVEGAVLKGNPFVIDDRLVLLNRCTGLVECLDISDPYHPKYINRKETLKYVEFCGKINGKIYIACGYGGLLKL